MKIVTLGEIMLRLTSHGYDRFVQAQTFEANYGGAEANVAATLSVWGEDARFVSKVPAHEIGQAVINTLRSVGVDTRFVLRGGERLGIYFVERGADSRASKVIYDRKNSAFSLSEAKEYDWDAIFAGADWFHVTGITPALGKNAEQLALTACQEAKKRGLTLSFDVNYRSKLWGTEQAKNVSEKLLGYTDVCIVNENQAMELFGISGENAMREFAEKYSLRCVAFTYRRTEDALHNRIWSTLYSEGKSVKSREYRMEMIDRIGGGDAFAAGLVYALGHDFELQRAADFAEAASCLKHSVPGDVCVCSLDEVLSLAEGKTLGRVSR
ncbi:MAG TPA: sugar kinase [Candidatus Borkfalkia faecipullorum]|uniref:Sugar kinase n=1 Tax=Candidatus Borkfalkia faecipullorum TaxID=2838510 RepID=A0A9D2AFF2_9FIRM|nr:sugar kinase [Candidatus Borkfalkia faecipullorum]